MLALALAFSTAHAASDPTTSISAPSGVYVYDTGRWTVSVSNGGNANASNVTVTINLPQTNTSPGVYVMGTVGAMKSGCTQSGTTITCSVGSLRKYRSTSVWFDIALPQSAGSLDFTATASTTSSENSTSNNDSSATASLLNDVVSFTAPALVDNDHCTGTGLESYFECELFPSSISTHETEFLAGGLISFPGYAGYSGTWSVVGDELSFTYTDGTGIVAQFVGYGVSPSCWEGLTTFPLSSYVSTYQVCLR